MKKRKTQHDSDILYSFNLKNYTEQIYVEKLTEFAGADTWYSDNYRNFKNDFGCEQ